MGTRLTDKIIATFLSPNRQTFLPEKEETIENPVESMFKGRDLIRKDYLKEGVFLLRSAIDGFSESITGKDSDHPGLYLAIDVCALLIPARIALRSSRIFWKAGPSTGS